VEVSVVSAAGTAEVAERAAIGLVLVREDGVEWFNRSAREMVESHGGDWGESHPVADLREGIRPGARDVTVRWPAPDGSTRWWQVTCTVLEPPARTLLYEISDRTALFFLERRMGVPVAEWRLSRFQALARMGSWVWNVEDDRLELSESLLVAFGLPPRAVLDGARAHVHPDDLVAVDEVLATALRTGLDFTSPGCTSPTGPARVWSSAGARCSPPPTADPSASWAPPATSPRSTWPAPSWPTWPTTTR
jgi:hypothetical protein